jgi:hypothetical protein
MDMDNVDPHKLATVPNGLGGDVANMRDEL